MTFREIFLFRIGELPEQCMHSFVLEEWLGGIAMPADDVMIVGSAGTETVVYSSLFITPRHLAQNPFKSFGVHLIVFEQKSLTKAVTFAHVAHDC